MSSSMQHLTCADCLDDSRDGHHNCCATYIPLTVDSLEFIMISPFSCWPIQVVLKNRLVL